MAAGQAGACLHTMAILQMYQADLLRYMDEDKGVRPVSPAHQGNDSQVPGAAAKEPSASSSLNRKQQENFTSRVPHQ